MANLNPKRHWTGAVKTICHTNWLVEKIVVYLLLFSMLLGKGFINVTRATTTQRVGKENKSRICVLWLKLDLFVWVPGGDCNLVELR